MRQQLSKALGGRRGMAEAAVRPSSSPLTWLTQRDLDLALMVSVGAALVLLAVRLVQRSTVQFVVNALFGIAIGWYFVHRSAAAGGSEQDQALAYFLPGILYNGGYAVVLAFTCLIGWPLVGFMVGSITGDPTAWHSGQADREALHPAHLAAGRPVPAARRDPGSDLARRQRPASMDPDTAVAILGVSKIVLGWPLQLAALGSMVWLLSRNRTPVSPDAAPA